MRQLSVASFDVIIDRFHLHGLRKEGTKFEDQIYLFNSYFYSILWVSPFLLHVPAHGRAGARRAISTSRSGHDA